MSKLDQYKRAIDTLKNLDKIRPEKQMGMLICMKLILDPNDPVSGAKEALAVAVEKGWVEISGEDPQSKTIIHVTPAGEEYVASLTPKDFGLDRDDWTERRAREVSAEIRRKTHKGEDTGLTQDA